MMSPKPLSEEQLKQLKQQEEVAAIKGAYMALWDRDKRIYDHIMERNKQIDDKINLYRKERLALPKDADGIYLILGGQARIEN